MRIVKRHGNPYEQSVPRAETISTAVVKAGEKERRCGALRRFLAHGLLQDSLGVVAFESLCSSRDRLDPQYSPTRSVLLRGSLP